mmetsp:Transcript_37297/g.42614  ORF Transcript_37297/g.42614 Transcript_37297/m.42614 type:complete len:205 (-) Transcript_37297:276-890(-)
MLISSHKISSRLSAFSSGKMRYLHISRSSRFLVFCSNLLLVKLCNITKPLDQRETIDGIPPPGVSSNWTSVSSLVLYESPSESHDVSAKHRSSLGHSLACPFGQGVLHNSEAPCQSIPQKKCRFLSFISMSLEIALCCLLTPLAVFRCFFINNCPVVKYIGCALSSLISCDVKRTFGLNGSRYDFRKLCRGFRSNTSKLNVSLF